MSFDRCFLIVETGRPLPSMRRYGGFPHWIRVAAGLSEGDAVVVDVEHGATLPDVDDFAGVIVTGSGAMVTDRADWSERTAAWLRDAAHAGVPLFGICYGHQLLAHALGGEVGENPRGREMGTFDVETEAAASDDPLFAAAGPRFPAQTTHLQTVLRLPEGATLLAHSELEPHHAFRWGDRAWGVQFHPEFSATHMRGYIRARSGPLYQEGLDPVALVAAVRAAPEARAVLQRFVRFAGALPRD
ncbi:glutamine amidotransferase [Luteimonas sp. 3794]|uniref:glutamine amidotransferase n=1 Tax=Luteimonas sp. 3794 TaxID=2817730 RepID=UPI002860DA42|nr:glutamine amidotransferase [Luteimonas sp. 3794]MDR6989920.1 GMP synthase (glutamine-hydrolyzing) [Luteimonas sp. 3794]